MYHTHQNDIDQLARGLFGPIVVTPHDAERDTSVDHTYIMGWRTPNPQNLEELEVNGIMITDPQPTVHTRLGTSHRLRLMNITAAGNVSMSMTKDGEIVPLQFLSKDGADLPDHMRPMLDQLPRLFVGETADMRFAPTEPGTYELQVGYGGPALARQTWVVE